MRVCICSVAGQPQIDEISRQVDLSFVVDPEKELIPERSYLRGIR